MGRFRLFQLHAMDSRDSIRAGGAVNVAFQLHAMDSWRWLRGPYTSVYGMTFNSMQWILLIHSMGVTLELQPSFNSMQWIPDVAGTIGNRKRNPDLSTPCNGFPAPREVRVA